METVDARSGLTRIDRDECLRLLAGRLHPRARHRAV